MISRRNTPDVSVEIPVDNEGRIIRPRVNEVNESLRALVLVAAALITNCASAACPATMRSASDSDVPSPDMSGNVVIREIYILNGDVFDLSNPDYDGAIHRFMNAVHIQTKDDVIRRQLLFSPGDYFSTNDALETARYLRENRYLADAEVSPVNCENGQVDLEVRTVDAWSLIPSISFARRGGRNFGGFEIQETNLFGFGSELKLAYDAEVERDLLSMRYVDRQIGASRAAILIALQDNSDGSGYELNLEQPFYSLNTRRAGGIQMHRFDQLDAIYDLGERRGEVRHDGARFEGYYGWSNGLRSGHVLRWKAGIGYDEQHFEPIAAASLPLRPPADRRDVYPFIGVEWLENRYETARNHDQIARVEDRHTGTRLALQIGYAATAVGSMDNAVRLDLAASRGFHPFPGDTVLLRSALELRQPLTAGSSYRFQAGARYYHQQSQKRLLFVQLSAAAGRNVDTDRQLGLGGGTGLRAYPVRYQNGDSTALFTLEQRYFTDWYPLHLFRVGAAAFFDAGRVWGDGGADRADLGTLKDVGVGLRIGSPHSASGRMLHLDLAYALDGPANVRGWQLFIETRTNF